MLHRVVARLLARAKNRFDKYGGVLPENPALARKHDLVTFKPGTTGASCANCMFLEETYCPVIKSEVSPPNQCCSAWDQPGTVRSWKG